LREAHLLLRGRSSIGLIRFPLWPLLSRLRSRLGLLRLRRRIVTEARQLLAIQTGDEAAGKGRWRSEPRRPRSDYGCRGVITYPRRLQSRRTRRPLGHRSWRSPKGPLQLLRSCRAHDWPLLRRRRRSGRLLMLHERSRLSRTTVGLLLVLLTLAQLGHRSDVRDAAKCRPARLPGPRGSGGPDADQKLP
jgi:hypothetical protein